MPEILYLGLALQVHGVPRRPHQCQPEEFLKDWLRPYLQPPVSQLLCLILPFSLLYRCISPEELGPHRVSSQSKILLYLTSFKWMFLVPFTLSLLPLGLSFVGWTQTPHDSNCSSTQCLWDTIWWPINICWMTCLNRNIGGVYKNSKILSQGGTGILWELREF